MLHIHMLLMLHVLSRILSLLLVALVLSYKRYKGCR